MAKLAVSVPGPAIVTELVPAKGAVTEIDAVDDVHVAKAYPELAVAETTMEALALYHWLPVGLVLPDPLGLETKETWN